MAGSGGCELLNKTNAKALIDSVDTVLTDCDGNTLVCLSISRSVPITRRT